MKHNEEPVESHESEMLEYSTMVVPALTSALGTVTGKNVLDLGCGSGRFARLLAAQGAIVTGVDQSQRQVDRARKREAVDGLGIVYRRADATRARIPADAYDTVLLMFVLVALQSPTTAKRMIATAARSLKPGGLLVVGDVHPHNLCRDNDVERTTLKGGKTYFDNGAATRSAARLRDGRTRVFDPSYHYRLDFIFNTVCEAGLAIKSFVELGYRTRFPTHVLLVAKRVP